MVFWNLTIRMDIQLWTRWATHSWKWPEKAFLKNAERVAFEDASPFQKVLIFHCHVTFQPGKFVNSWHQTWHPKKICLAGMMWKTHIAKSVASLKLAFLNSTRSFNVFVSPSKDGKGENMLFDNIDITCLNGHCFKWKLLQQTAMNKWRGNASVIAKQNSCNRSMFASYQSWHQTLVLYLCSLFNIILK